MEQYHSKPITGNPYSSDSTGIKIGFTVNAEKVFKTLTAKQLEKLNTSDAIHDFKAYLEEDLQYFSQTELQNYPKDLNIRSLILINDWEKAIEKYSHLNPTTE